MGENYSKQKKEKDEKKKKEFEKNLRKLNGYEDDDINENIIDTYEIYEKDKINNQLVQINKDVNKKEDEKEQTKDEDENEDEDSLENPNLKLKEVKLIDPNACCVLNIFFNDYKCSKCFLSIIIQISRNKDDNFLYISTKCINNHTETKTLSKFLKENKFTIGKDFKFYNYFEERYEDYDEYYLICFKCKKIYHTL